MEDKASVGSKELSLRKKSPAFILNLFDFAETCVIAAVIAILTLFFMAKTGTVVGESMMNTMHPNDRYILTDLFYTPAQGDIIVFAPGKEHDPEDKFWVKRVIATEGQTVEIKDGRVFVDGEILDESYLSNICYFDNDNVRFTVYVNGEYITVVCGTETYFVSSGESLNISGLDYNFEIKDGDLYINGEYNETAVIETVPRITENPITVPDGEVYVMGDNRINSKDSRYIGTVDIRKIIGHVIFRFWPFNNMGLVD